MNSYPDSKSLLVSIPGQRQIEIKYDTGKNGDLDLSALGEGKWPEYQENFHQYTKIPKLTLDIVDYYK